MPPHSSCTTLSDPARLVLLALTMITGSAAVRSVVVPLLHPLDRGSEFAEVVVDGAADDFDLTGEVSVRQVVPHARDLTPRDFRLRCREVRAERLHGLANLDQSNSDGVQDEIILEVAPTQMRSNGVDRR